MDPPLSETGRSQASLLAARLAGRSFSAFYASDLKRAFETAEIVGGAIRHAPVPMAALREVFLGEWEGLTTEEIAQRYPEGWSRWVEEPNWDVVPGGEGEAAFEARVRAAIEDVTRRHTDGDVLIVTHGGVIQVVLHNVVARASRGIFPFRIQNASITIVESRDGRSVIAGVNDIAHLESPVVTKARPA